MILIDSREEFSEAARWARSQWVAERVAAASTAVRYPQLTDDDLAFLEMLGAASAASAAEEEVNIDADGDGWKDSVELALGSDPFDRFSQPGGAPVVVPASTQSLRVLLGLLRLHFGAQRAKRQLRKPSECA